VQEADIIDKIIKEINSGVSIFLKGAFIFLAPNPFRIYLFLSYVNIEGRKTLIFILQ
jgi:hypothetical protein